MCIAMEEGHYCAPSIAYAQLLRRGRATEPLILLGSGKSAGFDLEEKDDRVGSTSQPSDSENAGYSVTVTGNRLDRRLGRPRPTFRLYVQPSGLRPQALSTWSYVKNAHDRIHAYDVMEVEKTISPNYCAAPSEQPVTVVLAVDDWPVLRKTGHESETRDK